MAKASIFSKDYKKIMRRRKRRLRIIYFLTFVIVTIVSVKLINYDFSVIERRLQLWVNSDRNNTNKIEEVEDTDINKEPENIDNNEVDLKSNEKVKEEKNNANVSVTIKDVNMTLVLNDSGNKKVIEKIENKPENYYSSISNDKQNALIIDNLQNLYLIKNNGEVIDLTLYKYIAPDGESFEKDKVITTYNGYLWHSNAKVLSNDRIIYVTNIPYFGYDLNQYVTIIDLNSKSHKTIWNMKGKNINLGEFNESRLEVTIDGNIRYINENGEETS